MLKLTHDGQSVEVDPKTLALHEGLAIQEATGLRLQQFLTAIESGDMRALVAFAYVIVKFRLGKADVTYDDVASGRVPILFGDFVNTDPPAKAEGAEPADPTRAAGAKTAT